MNRPLTKQTPSGRTDRREYDVNGNLTKFTDRRGQAAMFTYDALNRLLRETYSDSTVERTYDPRGRLLAVDDSLGGVFTFAYDLVGRQLSAAGPTGTVHYQRDDLGRVVLRQVTGQAPVTYAYDPVGNLQSVAAPGASVSFTYDPRNLLLSQMRSNGVTTNYAYDALGQVLSLTHGKGATVLNAQTYSYDIVGQRGAYATDIAQPLITQPAMAEHDEDNRLTRRGAVTYTYDENGNRLSQTGPEGTTTYVWDARNRLQSITTPTGQTTTFHYDFARNLLAKETSGLGGGSESYVLDTLTNVVYQSNSNNQQFSILTGRSIDSHLAVIPPNGQATFGLGDTLNSTVATTDHTGAANGQFFYEPYGETTSSGNSYPFQYTGRTPAPGGLYYYRVRFYDPQAGRFISEDPIGFAGGDVNLYGYVGGEPVNASDPLGLTTVFIHLGGSGVLGGGYEKSKGIYLTTSNAHEWPDIGVLNTQGPSIGESFGLFAQLGYVSGPFSNFSGRTDSTNFGIGDISTSVIFNDVFDFTQDPIGYAVGVQTPGIGATINFSDTKPVGLVDSILNWLNKRNDPISHTKCHR